jgi:hypothetical protein
MGWCLQRVRGYGAGLDCADSLIDARERNFTHAANGMRDNTCIFMVHLQEHITGTVCGLGIAPRPRQHMLALNGIIRLPKRSANCTRCCAFIEHAF